MRVLVESVTTKVCEVEENVDNNRAVLVDLQRDMAERHAKATQLQREDGDSELVYTRLQEEALRSDGLRNICTLQLQRFKHDVHSAKRATLRQLETLRGVMGEKRNSEERRKSLLMQEHHERLELQRRLAQEATTRQDKYIELTGENAGILRQGTEAFYESILIRLKERTGIENADAMIEKWYAKDVMRDGLDHAVIDAGVRPFLLFHSSMLSCPEPSFVLASVTSASHAAAACAAHALTH